MRNSEQGVKAEDQAVVGVDMGRLLLRAGLLTDRARQFERQMRTGEFGLKDPDQDVLRSSQPIPLVKP